MVGYVVNKIVIPTVAVVWIVSLILSLIQYFTSVDFGFWGFMAFLVTILGFLAAIVLFVAWIISLLK